MTEPTSICECSEDRLRKRRRLLLAAVGGAAVLAGAGLAWRSYQLQETSQAALSSLWQLEFATPDGGLLKLADMRGRPLLLNFWATWCPPCVEEFPLLSSFYQENMANGWQVLGIAVDQLDSVKRFLVRSPVSFPVAMAGMSGVGLSRLLGNLSGGLPFTVLLDSGGRVVQRKMGQIKPHDLRQWAEYCHEKKLQNNIGKNC